MLGQFVEAMQTVSASSLRCTVADTPWKTVLASAADKGAAGLPGLFRQAMSEISRDITTLTSQPDALFIPCPNKLNQTGDGRNQLMINPVATDNKHLSRYQAIGQLIGVAIRSKCCLDIDLVPTFWKQLLREPLSSDDLATFDFSAWSSLQFRDPVSNREFDEDEFEAAFGEIRYTTVLSDGRTTVELRPGGAQQRVEYKERYQYVRDVVKARLFESRLQMHYVKLGLYSIVPREALSLLTWQELELRVCGEPTLDVQVLKRVTRYSPSSYTESAEIVQWFWKVLEDFSAEERAKFLQFAWARTRLPADLSRDRMLLNINENAEQEALPSAETCFFNVTLPRYDSIEQLRAKLTLAINECLNLSS